MGNEHTHPGHEQTQPGSGSPGAAEPATSAPGVAPATSAPIAAPGTQRTGESAYPMTVEHEQLPDGRSIRFYCGPDGKQP